MQRTMLKSKIHRATVTGSDLHYVGSITIDPELLEAADIRPHEQVAVVDAGTLLPPRELSGSIRLLVAARFGRARLIDNIGVRVP